MKLDTLKSALALAGIAAVLALVAALKAMPDSHFTGLMGFAGGLTTGAFALAQSEKKQEGSSDPKDLK